VELPAVHEPITLSGRLTLLLRQHHWPICSVATMTPGARDATPHSIVFCRATRADVGSIVSLVDDAYRGEGLGGWTTEAHLVGLRRTDAEAVDKVLAAPESILMLAEFNGELAGCIQLTNQGSYAVLGTFAVRPELQGQGIGAAILHEAERICRDEFGAQMIRMQVLHMRHDIISWYERRGYKPNGERVAFPYGDERVGTPRRDDLEFLVLMKCVGMMDHRTGPA
jgi:ribosomal protein S18 acetylase RimI-like enzyme